MQHLVRRETLPAVLSGTTVSINVGASHEESGAINAELVRLVATAACHVEFGTDPVATTGSLYLPANSVERFRLAPGDKVSVLQAASGGTLYITY